MDKSKLKASDLQVAAVTTTGSATKAFTMAHKMGCVKINLKAATPYNTKYYLSTDNTYVWYSQEKTTIYSSTNYSNAPIPYTTVVNTTQHCIVQANTPAAQSFTFTANKTKGSGTSTYSSSDINDSWSKTISLASGGNGSIDAACTGTYITESSYTLALGDVFYSDGSVSKPSSKFTEKTPIGIVAYIGNDAYTEKNYGGGHALVMSKFEDSSTRQWKTSNTESDLPNISTMSTAIADASGYKNCHTYLNSTTFPAAYYAMRHNLSYPEGKCTGWFLPTIGQWYKVFLALGKMPSNTFDESSASPDQVEGTKTILDNLNNALSYLGTAGTDYTKIRYTTSGSSPRYWSSSEHATDRAMDWGYLPTYSPPGINIGSDPSNKTWSQYVRPFLAF